LKPSAAASSRRPAHPEQHRVDRIGWLRAAVLGANDGIVSTASLMVGVAMAQVASDHVVLTGVAGLVAGAMSMAAGEYVSVHSQSDTEAADLRREQLELQTAPAAELLELENIYIARGVTPETATRVARELMAHDALNAHARDELGVTQLIRTRPVQAAFASACSFAVGAALPLVVALLVPRASLVLWIAGTSLLFLALMGVVAARISAADPWDSALRITFWGALAIAVTAGAGSLFDVVV
jgi:VIT1/CCC1 family predicted Fe2+/Mn2+ transporter